MGVDEGLPEDGVIACDNIVTLALGRLAIRRVGRLGPVKRAELDRALRYALDIQY